MKQKRKNRFWSFIFSFMPGAVEMYMGYMKSGLSLMALFFVSFIPMIFFSSLEFFSVLGVIMWFYGFFHARNYAAMSDEEISMVEDKYIWDELDNVNIKAFRATSNTAKKWIAAVLIIVGIAQLWDYLFDTLVHFIPDSYWDDIYPFLRGVPQVAIAILFIVIGARMILGKKKELVETPDTEGRLIAELPQKKAPETASETKEA